MRANSILTAMQPQINQWKSPEAEIWWSQVSGPKAYMKQVDVLIRNGKCVALAIQDIDTTFLQILKRRLQRFNSALTFQGFKTESYDSSGSFFGGLTEQLNPRFYPGLINPYQDVVANGMLQNCIPVILADETRSPWIYETAQDFGKVSLPGNGVMIFLCSDPNGLSNHCPAVQAVSLRDYVSMYNTQYFALQCLGNYETRDSKGAYIAQLVSRLAGANGKLASMLASPRLYDDPIDFWHQTISDNSEFTDLGRITDSDIREIVWEAQVQFILPIVERVRRYLVEKYMTELSGCLPREDEFGHWIEKPIDMELRHIHFYFLKQGKRFEYVDYNWFEQAYHARNEISHLKVLPKEELDSLFDIEAALSGIKSKL